MTLTLFLLIYLLIGVGFAVAADESKPEKHTSLALLFFVLFWPGVVAYVIGKIKVNI